jgi:hypothetical protein
MSPASKLERSREAERFRVVRRSIGPAADKVNPAGPADRSRRAYRPPTPAEEQYELPERWDGMS